PQQGAGHGGDAEHGGEESLILAALAGRDDVTDDGQGKRHQAARAQTLDGSARDHDVDTREVQEVGDLGENPQTTEPIKKTTIAAWKIGRRPRKSEILPQSGVAAVEVSRYAVTTQESLSSPPNSEVILGKATAT